MAYHWLIKPKVWLYGSLSLLLMLMIACGAAEESPAETTSAQPSGSSAADTAMQQPAGPPPAAQRQPSTSMTGGEGATTSGSDPMGQTAAQAEPAPTAVPEPVPSEPMVDARQVTRLEFAITSANNETNRPWQGSRQAYVQYDPTLEYAIGIHPTTSEYVPELAHRWEANDDLSEWTFYLREGIQFHNGWGEVTADDFLHTIEQLTRPDSRLGTSRYFIGGRDDDSNPLAGPDQYFTQVDDHTFTVTFHGPEGNPSTTFDAEFVMSNASSETGPWSRAAWDSGGATPEEKEAKLDEIGLQGTGSYQYLDREPAQAFIIEKAPGVHWTQNADLPDGRVARGPGLPGNPALLGN